MHSENIFERARDRKYRAELQQIVYTALYMLPIILQTSETKQDSMWWVDAFTQKAYGLIELK